MCRTLWRAILGEGAPSSRDPPQPGAWTPARGSSLFLAAHGRIPPTGKTAPRAALQTRRPAPAPGEIIVPPATFLVGGGAQAGSSRGPWTRCTAPAANPQPPKTLQHRTQRTARLGQQRRCHRRKMTQRPLSGMPIRSWTALGGLPPVHPRACWTATRPREASASTFLLPSSTSYHRGWGLRRGRPSRQLGGSRGRNRVPAGCSYLTSPPARVRLGGGGPSEAPR